MVASSIASRLLPYQLMCGCCAMTQVVGGVAEAEVVTVTTTTVVLEVRVMCHVVEDQLMVAIDLAVVVVVVAMTTKMMPPLLVDTVDVATLPAVASLEDQVGLDVTATTDDSRT